MQIARLPIQAQLTHSSKGRRPTQEDAVLADREKAVFVAADGFGGPAAGQEAARLACEAVRSFLFREAGDLEATLPFILRQYFSLAGNVLYNALIHANRKVHAAQKKRGVHESGAASVVAGFLDGDLLALGNVGACSAWLLRAGGCVELVRPRTFGFLRDPFGSGASETDRVPLMAVGMAEDLEPEILECRIRQGDWLVLNTDGISAGVVEALARIQGKGLPPDEAAREAKAQLSSYEYDDNASILLNIF